MQNQVQRPFIYDIKYDKENDDIIIDDKSEINILEKYTFECPSAPFGGIEEIDISNDGTKIYFVCKGLLGEKIPFQQIQIYLNIVLEKMNY